MSFESQFHASFVNNLLTHRLLRQTRNFRQSGTFANYIQGSGSLAGLSHFIQRFRFLQQDIRIAVHNKVIGVRIVFRRNGLGHQEFAHVISGIRIRTLVSLPVEVRTTCIKNRQFFPFVTFFILAHKFLRRLIPAVAACNKVRVAGPHKSGKPGRLPVRSPEIIFRTSGILHFKQRFGTVIDSSIEVIFILAGGKVVTQVRNLIAQFHHVFIITRMVGSQCQVNIRQHGKGGILTGTSFFFFIIFRFRRKQIDRILTVRNDLLISLIQRSACYCSRFTRIIRFQTQRNTAIQTG